MFSSTSTFFASDKDHSNTNTNQSIKSLITPMSLRMLTGGVKFNPENQSFEFCGRPINLVSVVGRVLQASHDDGNQMKVKVNFTDDTQSIQMAYFIKQSNTEQQQELMNPEICGEYVKFIISPKIYQNVIYYNALHYQVILDQNALTLFLSQMMFLNQPTKEAQIEAFMLSSEPVDLQVELYFKNYKQQPIPIHQLMEIFRPKNVSMQHMKLIVEGLKKKQVIMDCMTPQTYMSFQ